MGGWLGGNQVENHATSWSNLQDCKISIKAEIPKLDPSVAKIHYDGWVCSTAVLIPVIYFFYFLKNISPKHLKLTSKLILKSTYFFKFLVGDYLKLGSCTKGNILEEPF